MKAIRHIPLLGVAIASLVAVGCDDAQSGSGGSGGAGGSGGVADACPQSSYCIDGVEMAPTIGVRSASILTVDGRDFKDSNGNGELDVYEDWRLAPADRANDLVSKMDVTQLIGLLSETGWVGPTNESGDLSQSQVENITTNHVRYGLVRWPGGATATTMATHMNNLQELAESLPLGIPVLITTDPIFGVSSDMSSSELTHENTAPHLTSWPLPLGFGAIDDEEYVKQVAEYHAAQLRAVGVRWMLGPMVDVATEPMWARVHDTYGARSDRVGALAEAYIRGFQGKDDGVNPFTGVAATVKHFPGAGPDENGMDSHSEPGQFNVFPGDNFGAHIDAMRTAIEGANPAALMPCYSIFENVSIDDVAVEQLGASYSKVIMLDLLRDDMGWDGLVTSDWGAIGVCFSADDCRQSQAWGTDTWTNAERVAAYVEAGGHQIGLWVDPRVMWEDALDAGAITEAQIAAAAHKALEVTFQVGAFEDPYVDASLAQSVQESFEDEAHDAMMRAFTLLRNDEAILPLDAGTTDRNGIAGIQVFFDGHDDAKILDYTSNLTGFQAVESIADADYAIIRVSARRGVYYGLDGGVPLGYRDAVKVYDQETSMPSDVDSTARPLVGMSAPENNAASMAIADTIDAHIATKGPDTQMIFVVSMDRPFIWTEYMANTSVLAAEFGATDAAVLDMIFQMKDGIQDASIQPAGTLPMELPSSQVEVYAQYEDVPHDTLNPTYPIGAGITSY